MPIGINNVAPGDPLTALSRRIADLERLVRELAVAHTLENASIGQGGLQSADFDGALPSTAGTTGWALGGSGSNAIFNNIVLRGGIIGNDALNAPVLPFRGHAEANGYSITTTPTEISRITFTPPAGYSQALVLANTEIRARNKNTVQDYLAGYVSINGATHGWDSGQDGPAGYGISITNTATTLLTGLSGNFFVRSLAYSGAANWATDSFNAMNLDAMILYLR